jgi:hypothetical protein
LPRPPNRPDIHAAKREPNREVVVKAYESGLAALAAALFMVLAVATAAAPAPVRAQANELCPERYHVDVGGERLGLPYCSTHPLDRPDPAITRIVFSIHGVATNAETYFANMVRAAERVPGAVESTLIIGPQLMTEAYAVTVPVGDADLFWATSAGRFWGGESGSSDAFPRRAAVSSFEVMDRLLADLTDPALFPNLEIIVVAGHSGGGQLSNRHAAASLFEDEAAARRGVRVRWVVSNPSTYVYLTPERAAPNSRTREEFDLPAADLIEACPGYDTYGSGLQGLEDWPWLGRVGAERMKAQYGRRDVVYLMGMNDSDPQGAALARGCEAMLQGDHRLERGITYFNHIEDFYGPGGHRHRIAFVPRVAHDHAGIWASDEGLLHIFDHAVTLAP